ncbi:MAG: CU044_2847 family protein [Pseudomonadota bacterium]
MKHLVEFKLEDGTSVIVESEDIGNGRSSQCVSRREDVIEKPEQTFTEAISRVRPAAETVLSAFRTLEQTEEIKIESGIKFNAKAGVVIAPVDSEATIKVTINWFDLT